MTTEARERLMDRSMLLTDAADSQLARKKNEAKGDGWRDVLLYDLMLKLEEELAEFRHAAYALEAGGEMGYGIDLLLEGGDVINVMRFICDRAGVLGS